MTMLYLCRHAIAEDLRGRMKDEDRKLTTEGRKKFHRAAEGFLKLVGKKAVAKILSSPLVRARETAEILAEVMGVSEVELLSGLAPPGDLRVVVREVRRLGGPSGGVVVVGHEPIFGDWVGELCFGRAGHLKLKKGGIAAIELAVAGTRGELRALWEPAVLRAVSK